MNDADATILYTRVDRVPFDGTGDALDFIITIEARNETRSNDYQRTRIVELSIQAAAHDWFV